MTESFELLAPGGGVRVPLIVHVPHSSTRIPADLRASFALNDEALEAELLAMTDRYTDELFDSALARGGGLFVNRTSRLVVDPERFPDDDEEPMAATGMGAVYRRTSGGGALRLDSFGAEDRSQLIERFFEHYARRLEEWVTEVLDEFGTCFIVDGHSFPSAPLAYERADLRRPEFCLGYEAFHMESALVSELEGLLRARGVDVAHNQPFAGSYVPLRHYLRDPRVRSVMVEVRRDLYVDEVTGQRSAAFGEIRSLIDELLGCVVRWGLESGGP